MSAVPLVVRPPAGSDLDGVAGAIASGVNDLARQLGLPPPAVEVADGGAEEATEGAPPLAWLGGTPLGEGEIDNPRASGDRYATAVVAACTSGRGLLATREAVDEVLQRVGGDITEPYAGATVWRAVALGVNAEQAARHVSGITSWAESYEALAAALGPTDDEPFRIEVPPVQGFETAEAVKERDTALRKDLYLSLSMLLPECLALDPDATAATVRVRSVTYPPLPFTAPDPESGTSGVNIYFLAGRNVDSLTTRHSLAATLAVATRSLPVATQLARARWPGSALVEAYRRSQRAGLPSADEVAFIFEQLGMLGPDVPMGAGQELLPFIAVDGLPVPEGTPPAEAVTGRLQNV
jgi:hypothetical protein